MTYVLQGLISPPGTIAGLQASHERHRIGMLYDPRLDHAGPRILFLILSLAGHPYTVGVPQQVLEQIYQPVRRRARGGVWHAVDIGQRPCWGGKTPPDHLTRQSLVVLTTTLCGRSCKPHLTRLGAWKYYGFPSARWPRLFSDGLARSQSVT